MSSAFGHGPLQCPVCSIVVADEKIFGIHLSYCRKVKSSRKEESWQCQYNTMHVIPMTERERHLHTCPDKGPISANLSDVGVGIVRIQRKLVAPRRFWCAQPVFVGSVNSSPSWRPKSVNNPRPPISIGSSIAQRPTAIAQPMNHTKFHQNRPNHL